MVKWWPTCNYNTCTRGHRASFLILLMMGVWRPKHVEWLCRNKTCTVLHQVGGLFDLYYDGARLFGRPACSLVTMPTELFSFRIFPRSERRFAVGSMHTSYWEEPASNLGPDTNYPGRILERFSVPNMVMWWPTCNYNTCTRDRRASFLILLMMDPWSPKHVEWLCRNKTCTSP